MRYLGGDIQQMSGNNDLWPRRRSGMKFWGNYQPFGRQVEEEADEGYGEGTV